MTCRVRRWLSLLIVLLAIVAAEVVRCPPARAQAVVGVVDLGNNGDGVAVNPITDRLYIALAGQLNVYDAQTYTLITSIPLPQNYVACGDVAVNVITNRIYVTGFRTYVVDGDSNTVLANLNQEGSELAVNPITNRVYITDYSYHSSSHPFVVRVLDGADNTWLPDIAIGSSSSYQEVHLAVNAPANRVYVTFAGDDDLRVLDASTHAEVGRVDFSTIGYVAVNPRTGWIYVGIGEDGVAVLDGTSYARIATIASLSGRLRLNARTDRLVAAECGGADTVFRIADLANNRVTGYVYLDGGIANFELHPELGQIFAPHESYPAEWAKKMTVIQDASAHGPAPEPPLPCVAAVADLSAIGRSVGVNAKTNRVYVGLEGGLLVLDANTLQALPYINLATSSFGPYIDDVGVNETLNRVYAVDGGYVYVIDGASNRLLGKVTGGDEIAVNPSNGRIYIADRAIYIGHPDVVRIYDGVTLALIRNIELGTSPKLETVHVAVNPTTGFAYATYTYDHNLHIIEPATSTVVQEIDYTGISSIAINPITNRIYVWASRSGESGVVVLDGNTHAELGMLRDLTGPLGINPQNNHLYGESGYDVTLLDFADASTGTIAGRVVVDGGVEDYAVHPGLARLYVAHWRTSGDWHRKLTVIQDTGGPPTPTPTVTPTRRPPITPTAWLYLPVVWRN
jgi:DNA-binding beta-propeller fold protein YncE